MRRIKQIAETKSMIAEALIKLLQNDSLEDITISQITSEAQIGRNTFYNHFKKKEDILFFIINSLLNRAKEYISSRQNPTLEEFLLWRFRLIRENPLLSVLNREEDIRLILKQFRDSQDNLLNLGFNDDVYKKAFILGGIESITLHWVNKGMIETPEEMTTKVMLIIIE